MGTDRDYRARPDSLISADYFPGDDPHPLTLEEIAKITRGRLGDPISIVVVNPRSQVVKALYDTSRNSGLILPGDSLTLVRLPHTETDEFRFDDQAGSGMAEVKDWAYEKDKAHLGTQTFDLVLADGTSNENVSVFGELARHTSLGLVGLDSASSEPNRKLFMSALAQVGPTFFGVVSTNVFTPFVS